MKNLEISLLKTHTTPESKKMPLSQGEVTGSPGGVDIADNEHEVLMSEKQPSSQINSINSNVVSPETDRKRAASDINLVEPLVMASDDFETTAAAPIPKLLEEAKRDSRLGDRVYALDGLEIVHAEPDDEHKPGVLARLGSCLGRQQSVYPDNYVVTSSYTIINFLPKNLWEQFQNVANIYFLLVGILQMIPSISTTGGIPTMYQPLSFILFVSALRAAVEDYAKHNSDAKRNSFLYTVMTPHGPKQTPSGKLQVGQVVRVNKNEMFPTDMLFLGSHSKQGHCFIDKANLNGETALQIKNSIRQLKDVFATEDSALSFSCAIDYEQPNGNFDSLRGTMYLPGKESFPVDGKVLLMREEVLRNTEYVYGLVLYTGNDTKIQRSNSAGVIVTAKVSRVMRNVNTYLKFMLGLQVALCILAGILCGSKVEVGRGQWYLDLKQQSAAEVGFLASWSWFILLSQMVPISLVVSSEMVKYLQSLFITWDLHLYWDPIDKPCKVNTSTIHEDLGLVDFIFSDKTGTLTQNKMQFRYCLTNHGEYGSKLTEIAKAVIQRQNEIKERKDKQAKGEAYFPPPVKPWTMLVRFMKMVRDDPVAAARQGIVLNEFTQQERDQVLQVLYGTPEKPGKEAAETKHTLALYMRHMALSNTIEPFEEDGELKFQAESAEELAMVKFAQSLGFIKRQQNPTILEILQYNSELQPTGFMSKEEYRRIATLGFTSQRARSSCVHIKSHLISSHLISPHLISSHLISSHLISSHLISPHLTSPHLISFHLISSHLISSHLISSHLTSPHLISSHLISSHLISPHLTSPHLTSPHLTSFHLTSPHPTPPHPTSPHLTSPHLTSPHPTPPHPIPPHLTSPHLTSPHRTAPHLSSHLMLCAWQVTVIYQRIADRKIVVMSKGQDTVMLPLLDPSSLKKQDELLTQLNELANNGLRTLVMAHAELPQEWWDSYQTEYNTVIALDETDASQGHPVKCQAAAGGCEKCVKHEFFAMIEKKANLAYLGCMGLEDQLQPLVPECIRDCLAAGIKVWMITGDKLEAAKNIGLACNLIDADMEPTISANDTVTDVMQAFSKSRLLQVTGQWAALVENHQELAALFDIFDSDHSGTLSLAELRVCLEALNFTKSENMGELFESVVDMGTADGTLEDGASSTTEITKKQFISLMQSARLTPFEAVRYDVLAAMETFMEIKDHSTHPVSLLVNRDAFHVLFARDAKSHTKSDGTICTEDEVEQLREQFFLLASVSKSVVFARAEPAMKKRMVTEIQARLPKAITLAIGDGANDTDMITAAHVGVGIAGVEGTAAVNSADYAIGSFMLLHTLIFVHGAWNYARTAELVYFIFYKAVLLAITGYFFGPQSQWSGQQFFNDPIYQIYNVCLTAFPIMAFSLVDQKLSAATLQNNPLAYSEQKGRSFRLEGFFSWIVRSFVHGAICYWVPILVLRESGAIGWARQTGWTTDIWYESSVVYLTICLLPNFMVFYVHTTINALNWFAEFVSFACILIFIYLAAIPAMRWFNPDLLGVIDMMFASGNVWFAVLLAVSIPMLMELAYRFAYRDLRPSYSQILQERVRVKQLQAKKRERLMGREKARAVASVGNEMGADEVQVETASPVDGDKRDLFSPIETGLVDMEEYQSQWAHRKVRTKHQGVFHTNQSVLDKLQEQVSEDQVKSGKDQQGFKMNVIRAMLQFRNLTGAQFDSAAQAKYQTHDTYESGQPSRTLAILEPEKAPVQFHRSPVTPSSMSTPGSESRASKPVPYRASSVPNAYAAAMHGDIHGDSHEEEAVSQGEGERREMKRAANQQQQLFSAEPDSPGPLANPSQIDNLMTPPSIRAPSGLRTNASPPNYGSTEFEDES
eukprot:g34298.t1